MNRATSCTWTSCIRTATALTAVAIAVGGCAAAVNNTTSAQAQGEQPYKTMYGISSDGTTTDLYTEFFGSRQPAPAPATTVATAQPVQSVTAEPLAPVQQSATSTSPARPGQAATATTPYRTNQTQTTAANRAPQPAYAPAQPAPAQVAQQPAPPPAPPEPDVPTVYGITANGPSTDLYTVLFGSK